MSHTEQEPLFGCTNCREDVSFPAEHLRAYQDDTWCQDCFDDAVKFADPEAPEWHDLQPFVMSAKHIPSTAKAEAVKEFVNMMIGALESGFVDTSNPSLATVHQAYRHHVKDNYGIDMPNIVEDWGQAVAELAGLKPTTNPTEISS